MKRLCILAAAAMMAVASWAEVTHTPVVLPGEDGGNFYRIPALLKCSDGSLLAVYDWRGDYNNDIRQSGAPGGRVKLMKKVSLDNGATWSTQQELFPGFLSEREHGDAALVADPSQPGHIVCAMATDAFYGLDGGRLFVAHSTDNGATWTTPAEMEIDNRPQWLAAFVASGKMLYTSGGDILAVVLGRTATEEKLYVLRSADKGYHWSVIGTTAAGNESKLVEKSDGSLLMSIRNPGLHLFADSTDGGVTWTRRASEISEPGINSAPVVLENDNMVLSIADHPMQRERLALYHSADGGDTWTRRLTLFAGLAAYSDIIDLDENRVGVLAEVIDEVRDHYTLKFFAVDKADLLKGNGDGDDENSIDAATAGGVTVTEYYTLGGVKVKSPEGRGVYICRSGNTTSKILGN